MNPNTEAPEQTTSFDVKKNPQDMQFMTDAMMYAPMLKQMGEDERKQAWPGMVDRLSQVSPKAKFLDPSLPPTDEALDSLLSQLPEDRGAPQQAAAEAGTRGGYLEDSVNRQISGKESQAPGEYLKESQQPQQPQPPQTDDQIMKGATSQAQEGMNVQNVAWGGDDENPGKLTKSAQTDVQKRYLNAQEGYAQMQSVYNKWDPEVFTVKGGATETILNMKSRLVGATPEEKAYLYKRKELTQLTGEALVLYRKMISGTAVGEKEMEELKKLQVNPGMSAAQAEAVRDTIMKKYMRDMMVYKSLLKDGINLDQKSDEFYGEFTKRRKVVQQDFDTELTRLKKENPGVNDMELQQHLLKQKMEGKY